MYWLRCLLRLILPVSPIGEKERLADSKRAETWVHAQFRDSQAASDINLVAEAIFLRLAHAVVAQRNVNWDGTVSGHPVTIEGACAFVWQELAYAVHNATGIAELLFEIQRCNMAWEQHPLSFLRWITVEAGNVRAELARESDVVDIRDPEVPRVFLQRIECGHVLALFLSHPA